jgi:hypothetical protein
MIGVIIGILVFSFNSFAGMTFYPNRTETWNNSSCRKTNTCDLKNARMSVQRWRAHYPHLGSAEDAFNYGDTMTFSYETQTIPALEKYIMVQYVKGCVYRTFKTEDGSIRTFFKDARYSHNATLRESTSVWIQREWVVDSDDKDPAYNSPFPEDLERMRVSDPEGSRTGHVSRHGLYRWNSIRNFDQNNTPTSDERSTELYYGFQYPPMYPKLYVTDRPGTAFIEYQNVDNREVYAAKNISLDFQACLYKSSDVPASVDDMGGQIFIPNPLKCFNWQSRHVFNWQSMKYENPTAMSRECLVYNP